MAVIMPMCQASTCCQVLAQWPLALLQVLQNNESLIFVLRVKTLSAPDRQ